MPFNVGPMELVVVLVIALIVLGPKRLPEAGKSVGRGIREFKGAITGSSDDETELGAAEPIVTPEAQAPREPDAPDPDRARAA